ncbi:hypothetical protein ASF49_09200 [Methylobacterium sp. Leaf104]|uniref:hypothetical protein n=1 Tax=Methylobacterium TaxID=407 RepID=UPI0006F33178|nr:MULTISPECIES: hypothetical protein [Methylobacterium]KQP31619.1 hypothetical protein ASF49_09200 [Methylobacterium sp. Leaf104]MCI9880516.1 hypothetical protein [Methylobacterium goesingense]
MPDFVALLAASALFCAALVALNGLTRLLLQMHGSIGDLSENGFAQYGLALALAALAWRRASRRKAL